MKVKTYCINKGESSQYFALITDEGQVLQHAPNNWKTEAGALRWARNHGYEIATKQTAKKKGAPARAAAFGSGGSKPKATAKQQPKNTSTNESRKIPKGRTVQTRDEYIEGGYPKPGYEDKGNYRRGVVIDSNELDELALVILISSKKGKPVSEGSKARYKPYIETRDNEGLPIKTGKKFIENPPKKDISQASVKAIRKDCNKYESNRKKLNDLKSRRRKPNKK